VHSESYVERLLDLKLDYSDMFNPKPRKPGVKYQLGRCLYDNEHTSDCIMLAAGAAVQAVIEVWQGPSTSSFANIRPPGHHAGQCKADGFCYVNNIAVAASYAKVTLGLTRILIVDFDVHHGNGTQDAFEADRDVLFVSIHRHDAGRFYPV
jgi:histone deacetylase 6